MAHGLPVGLAAHDDSDERLTGIAHMPETHDDARHAVSQALSGLGQFASPVFGRNALDLEWRVTRRIRLVYSDSLGYVRAHEQEGAL
jgi:hypothetical protein